MSGKMDIEESLIVKHIMEEMDNDLLQMALNLSPATYFAFVFSMIDGYCLVHEIPEEDKSELALKMLAISNATSH